MIKKFRDRSRLRAPRPRPGDDDRALHAGLHRAAGHDLPPEGRPRHRGHGGLHPQPPGSRGHRGAPSPRSAPTRNGRRRRGATGPGWPIPTWCRWPRGVRRSARRPPQPTRPAPATMSSVDRRRRCSTSTFPGATVTASGLRANVDVGIRYLASWLAGNGAAGIYNLMEDAATAEISRSQIWQWVQARGHTDEGDLIDADHVRSIADEVVGRMGAEMGETDPTRCGRRPAGSSSRWRSTPTTPSSSPFPPTSILETRSSDMSQTNDRAEPDCRPRGRVGRRTRVGRGSPVTTPPPTWSAPRADRRDTHPGAGRRREAVAAARRPRLRPRPRGDERRPGGADGQGRAGGDLPLRVAGGR